MSVELLSNTQEIRIANALKEIYYSSIVDDQFQDDSELFQCIVLLVDQNMASQREAIVSAGGAALRFSNTKELANAFWNNYRKCILATEEFAYKINNCLGYSVDLVSIIAPYFLYQAGVTDETLSFYIGLGLVVANIICDSLASKKAARDDAADEKNIKAICTEFTKFLTLSKKHVNEKEQDVINKSIEELEKIINTEDA